MPRPVRACTPHPTLPEERCTPSGVRPGPTRPARPSRLPGVRLAEGTKTRTRIRRTAQPARTPVTRFRSRRVDAIFLGRLTGPTCIPSIRVIVCDKAGGVFSAFARGPPPRSSNGFSAQVSTPVTRDDNARGLVRQIARRAAAPWAAAAPSFQVNVCTSGSGGNARS
jgi:hypothetical protein